MSRPARVPTDNRQVPGSSPGGATNPGAYTQQPRAHSDPRPSQDHSQDAPAGASSLPQASVPPSERLRPTNSRTATTIVGRIGSDALQGTPLLDLRRTTAVAPREHCVPSARTMGESHRDERQYIDVLAGPQRGTTPKRRGIELAGRPSDGARAIASASGPLECATRDQETRRAVG